eukprot:752214-Hanusia_phi.AAC.2
MPCCPGVDGVNRQRRGKSLPAQMCRCLFCNGQVKVASTGQRLDSQQAPASCPKPLRRFRSTTVSVIVVCRLSYLTFTFFELNTIDVLVWGQSRRLILP